MLGQVAYTHGEYPEAEDLYRQALALHEAIGNPNQISWCLRTLSDLLAIQGRYAEARETAFQGMKIARTTGDPHQVAYTYAALAKIATGERHYEEASEFSQQSLEAFKSTDSREGPAWVQIDLCPIALDLGDVDELERRARDSLSVFEDTQSPWGRSAALYYVGEAARLKGDLAAARDLLVQSIRLADGASSVMLVVRHLVGFAAWLAQTGEPQRAVELLALVTHHPATWQVTRARAKHLLAELAATLPPENALTAQESGTKLSVDAVVADILSHYWL